MKIIQLIILIIISLLFSACGNYGYLYIKETKQEQYNYEKQINDKQYKKNSYLNKLLLN